MSPRDLRIITRQPARSVEVSTPLTRRGHLRTPSVRLQIGNSVRVITAAEARQLAADLILIAETEEAAAA